MNCHLRGPEWDYNDIYMRLPNGGLLNTGLTVYNMQSGHGDGDSGKTWGQGLIVLPYDTTMALLEEDCK